MLAMMLFETNTDLVAMEIPVPKPGPKEVLLAVEACAVCRTDIHIIDGDLKAPYYPLIPGHEIVGRVVELGANVTRFKVGDRVGVPWLGKTCGKCEYCLSGQENLCDDPEFTGFHRPGGFAQYTCGHEDYIFPMPHGYSPHHAAPLLCAGLIGFRSYNMVRDKNCIGLFGFGAAAHIIAQVALFEGHEVYAFTRQGDTKKQKFARQLGCTWCGGSEDEPPRPLDAAIIFAPVGSLVPIALERVKKGGTVVCAGIHMTDIPSFPYSILWGERIVRSVANLTRRDGEEFFKIAPRVSIMPKITMYSLKEVNRAISDIRHGRIQGAAVLTVK